MATSVTTSFVKLSVPGNKNGDDSHIEEQENFVITRFNQSRIETKIDGERIKVSSDHEDPFYETTFQIKSENVFSTWFLEIVAQVVDGLDMTYQRLAGTLSLHHPALFDKNLILFEKDLPTERILFGNIWNTIFYNHWDVCFPNQNNNNRKGNSQNRSTLRNGHVVEYDQIKTHFDFDRPYPITVEFTIREQRLREVPVKPENGNSQVIKADKGHESNTRMEMQPADVKYQLSFEGDSIRQVIVDNTFFWKNDGNQKVFKKRIYFVLKTPVVVRNTINFVLGSEKAPAFNNRTLDLPCGHTPKRRSSRKVLTENKIFCLEFEDIDNEKIYTIVSRLRSRFNVPVEFARFYDNDYIIPYGKDYPDPIKRETCFGESIYKFNDSPDSKQEQYNSIWNSMFEHTPGYDKGAKNARAYLHERKFAYTYLIEALMSRGSVVKDQLIIDLDKWKRFISIIKEHVEDDNKEHISLYERQILCESALEDLLNHVDNQVRVGDLIDVFKRLCVARRDSQTANKVSQESWANGYRKVRKAIMTPTRLIYLAPEIIMSNRAITGADQDGTRIIRATIRDDSMQKLRLSNLRELHEEVVIGHLAEGFEIMGRCYGYLASSNSQMRDGGGYFMERYNKTQLDEYIDRKGKLPDSSFKPKIIDYRRKLGHFENTGSISKAMARLGQCFTQARSCEGVEIELDDYQIIPDVMGGKNASGSPYTFTDGVGTISVRLATDICKSIGIADGSVPCCYQIRFRGYKGVLVTDPSLDDQADHFKDIYNRVFMTKISSEKEDLVPYTKKVLFRDSQEKFHGSQQGKSKWPIELVKWSAPTPVTLNKPFINILDQASALQSLACHEKIIGRIEQLLDIEMDTFSKCIVKEDNCRSRLEGMPHRINFDGLERKYGFSLSTEPFFRSLIKASIDVCLARLLRKVQIPIPTNLGRSMFGVTDETGQLQYGQVYVRYTENINNKTPQKNSGKVLTGPIMVTKFPTMCAGDVRMYEAVDIPELHHLTDVIVFPQSGPRSQPDEMAGSDLDGDEYAVIWDPILFFQKNAPAFGYCSEKKNKQFTLEEMDYKMNEFFALSMRQEDVGVTAINHLHQSDQFGIDSDVANSLVEKNAMALDFAKSGDPPLPLTNEGRINPETGLWEPPERSERRPDFSQNRHAGSASYASSRLLGTLHRELRSINDVVVSSSEKQVPVVIDDLLIWEGWEKHKDNATLQMIRYNGQLRSIMETFGVATEAEVFSGCFRDIRNRQSEREQDDMSMYNTESVIEGQMTDLYKKYRKEFFEEFVTPEAGMPAYMRLTEPENVRRNYEEVDVLRRVCKQPSNAMMAKAIAYYRVCYENAMKGSDRKLSFAWIAYDILNIVRGKNIMEMENVPVPRLPQFQAICDHRNAFITDDKNRPKSKYSQFIRRFNPVGKVGESLTQQEIQAKNIIFKYVQHNMELQKCLFIIDSWARVKGLICDSDDLTACRYNTQREKLLTSASESSLKWYHLALMVIMVATKKLGTLMDEKQGQSGSKIFEAIHSSDNDLIKKKLTDADLDRLTISFFRFLSTREFRRLRVLNFSSIGLKSVFMRGEWLVYHAAATQTYYNILLNLRFDELPTSSESIADKQSIHREGDPILLEIPFETNIEKLLNQLREKSRCVQIDGRFDTRFKKKGYGRIIVLSRGTTEAINELKDFTTIKLPRYLSPQDRSISEELSYLLYFKIMDERFVRTIQGTPSQGNRLRPNKKGMNKTVRSAPARMNNNRRFREYGAVNRAYGGYDDIYQRHANSYS
ncbi:unnamed protein product [Caenorhabditis nigoni]